MAQKPYKTSPDIGVVGAVSATGGEQRIVSYVAAVALATGIAVCFEGDTVTNVGTNRNFAGIIVNTSLGGGTTDDTYAVDNLAPVLDKGSVFCTLVTGSPDAVIGAPVHRVIATGAISAAPASGTATVVIPNARFESAGSAGDIVDVRLG